VIAKLQVLGHDTGRLRSKSWHEFTEQNATLLHRYERLDLRQLGATSVALQSVILQPKIFHLNRWRTGNTTDQMQIGGEIPNVRRKYLSPNEARRLIEAAGNVGRQASVTSCCSL
jgi:hypothetical protein